MYNITIFIKEKLFSSNRFIIKSNINRFELYGKFLAFINIFNESS